MNSIVATSLAHIINDNEKIIKLAKENIAAAKLVAENLLGDVDSISISLDDVAVIISKNPDKRVGADRMIHSIKHRW